MKDKKTFKHIQLFLSDHLLIILLFLIGPVGFTSSYILLNGNAKDLPYYIFLSIFILICYLGYRFYSTWNFYDLICNDKFSPEDLFIGKPRCREEKHYKLIARRLENTYLSDLENQKEIQKTNKIMIYRWVHQLKTPLSVIKLIAEAHKFDEDYRKIMSSSNQIQYDLDQILNMYKLDDIKNDFHAEKICLYDVMKTSINELKNSFIMKGIYPKLNISKNIYVYSDVKWLNFCVYQILTNAIKYSEKNNKIWLYTKQENDKIYLYIKDEGCGIDKADIDRIFDLFFTGENGHIYGESSGLGLYMVKEILDYLGHTITISSIINEGTTVSICFDTFLLQEEV